MAKDIKAFIFYLLWVIKNTPLHPMYILGCSSTSTSMDIFMLISLCFGSYGCYSFEYDMDIAFIWHNHKWVPNALIIQSNAYTFRVIDSLNQAISSYDLTNLLEIWKHFETYIFSKIDPCKVNCLCFIGKLHLLY